MVMQARFIVGVTAVAIVWSWLLSAPCLASEESLLQRATDQAIARIESDLAETSFEGVERVAVLPLIDDPSGYGTDALQSAVTRTDYRLFTRDSETWEQLLAEIEWGVKREDVMDPETVQKFGRIEGVDAILIGRFWNRGLRMEGNQAYVKLNVRLADVESGQILWSSGPLEGEALINESEAVSRYWKIGLIGLGVVGGLVCVLVFFWMLKRAYRPL